MLQLFIATQKDWLLLLIQDVRMERVFTLPDFSDSTILCVC